jgi:hypothetical protein
MKDSDLIKKFIRVEKTTLVLQILVCEIRWDGPYTPVSTWVVGKDFPDEVSQAEIQYAVTGMFEDPRYFRSCAECGEHQPVDWMYDDRICERCE